MFYDGLSRLLSANYDGGAVEYTYGYDVAGNLVNNNGVTRTYNAANQMTNDGTNALTYDNNGNLTNDGVNAYTWDRANRMLTAPGSTSYKYDGVGNRIAQTVSGVVSAYLNDVQPGLAQLLAETVSGNTTRYVQGVRGIHATESHAGVWSYFAQDGLGSVRGIVDDAAAVVSSQSYNPMGVPVTDYGKGFGFTGEFTDANDLLYLRARYYAPGKGVFTALDPFEGMTCTPMSLNGYSWVSGNMPNLTDPSGLCVEDWICRSLLQDNPVAYATLCLQNTQDRVSLCQTLVYRGEISAARQIGCRLQQDTDLWSQFREECLNPYRHYDYDTMARGRPRVSNCWDEVRRANMNFAFTPPYSSRTSSEIGCKIEIAGRKATDPPLYYGHTFILFTDNDGTIWEVGGYPTGLGLSGSYDDSSNASAEASGGAGFGQTKLKGSMTRFEEGSREYRNYVIDPNRTFPLVLASGPSACHQKLCLEDMVGRISDYGHSYYFYPGPNSNSFAHSVLAHCGIPAATPLGYYEYPAWNLVLGF